MQCSCGGETTERYSVSKKINLRWEYSICTACGRIDADFLYDYGKTKKLAHGYAARILYRAEE